MNTNSQPIKDRIRVDLIASQNTFHALLDSLKEEDLQRQSLNPGWKNGEILAHMTFGFIIVNALLPMTRLWGRLPKRSSKPFAWVLNAMTGPFNWVNALGARGQGKVFTHNRLSGIHDRVHNSLLRKLDSIQENEWQNGMYYPTRWDPNFEEFMSLEKLFHYPVTHFNFHLNQIAT